ncbi:MAG: type I-C CRISPR-associated protein Cas8c/Csd1 [Myxococcales bacterium]|jgi:CRISPR-associated protein Csd1|nr:type I-C CRISPR-associated protein Cas8c/Csd1 [Myxococcales bacterium]
MMLQALCAYAKRAELVEDPAFETRAVDYKLEIDAEGRFCGLTSLEETQEIELKNGKKKQQTVRRQMEGLPLSKKRVGLLPYFLVDNAAYVLGTPKAASKEGLDKAETYLAAYRDLLIQGAIADVPQIAAFLRFLDSPEQRALADQELTRLERNKADKRDGKMLVPSVNGELLHDIPEVRDAWRRHLSKERAKLPKGLCLVTGKMGPIELKHPIIKKLPGALQKGALLISFDKIAFQSQGFKQGQNAQVSPLAAQLYKTAINHLIAPKKGGKGLNSAVKLDDATLVALWTREEAPCADLTLSVLDSNAAPNSDEGKAILDAVWKGREQQSAKATAFYAVTLSGNAARVIIRDWIETTSAHIAKNIAQWFEDLQLSEEPEFFPLKRLIQSLEAMPTAKKDKRGLSPMLASQLFRSIVQGAPLPRSMLQATLQRMRVPPTLDKNDKLDPKYRFALQDRVALIKASLIRHSSPHLRKEISVSLDTSNHDPAYLLGRLFAVLEKLQINASGRGNDLNATIRDRYYGAASSTPSAVFGRLLSLSMNHASKLGGEGVWLEKIKGEILNALEAKPLPRTLSLEDQGLFAIGYYQQRSKFFEKKSAEKPAA